MVGKLEFHLYRKLHGASASIKRGDEYGNLEKILPGVSSMVIARGGREAEPSEYGRALLPGVLTGSGRKTWWSVDVIVANREYDNWHSTELSLVFCDSEASLKVQE